MNILRGALKWSVIFSTAVLSLFVFSCGNEDESPAGPVINSFAPTSVLAGQSVTISGSNFNPAPAGNQVLFNAVAATVTSASSTQLVVTVPATATTGKITVIANGKSAVSANDIVILQTSIGDFSPESGVVGTTVTIAGTNFSTIPTENMVAFNGAAATVTAASATELTVTVPAEATTGRITVTISGTETTSSSDFTVLEPAITGFFPPIAGAGVEVTITGNNFSTSTAENIVTFNGETATVTTASSTELKVTVPAGATSGPISVKVGPNTITSDADLEVCGSAELIISDVVVTNNSNSTSYGVSFKITNVGSVDADLSKIVMQNYVSQNDVRGDGDDKAASGFTLVTAPIVAPGESYTSSGAGYSITGGANTTSHPNLIITLFDSPDGSVAECNYDNNIVIVPFQ